MITCIRRMLEFVIHIRTHQYNSYNQMAFLILSLLLGCLSEAMDQNIAFVCSELAAIYFEERVEEIEAIFVEYEHDMVEGTEHMIVSSFEKCMNSMPRNIAITILESEGEPDPFVMSFVEYDLEKLKSVDVNFEFTAEQTALVNEFSKLVESLTNEEELGMDELELEQQRMQNAVSDYSGYSVIGIAAVVIGAAVVYNYIEQRREEEDKDHND